MPDARRIPPELYAAVAQLRQAGARVDILKQFNRGKPDLLVGKAGRTTLIYVDRSEVDASRKEMSTEVERFIAWWNLGLDRLAPAVKFCSTIEEAIEFANSSYVPPTDPDPDPPPPPPPVDTFSNAFYWHLTGEWDSLYLTGGTSRLVVTEGEDNANSRAPTVLFNHIVLPTDTPRRTEVGCVTTAKTFAEGEESLLQTEITFPADFPSVPTTQYIGVLRFSAFTNGLPPIELLVKKRPDNTEHVYLRHLGPEHDLASESTLDAAGGYIWSTPLLRTASVTQPNTLKIALKVKWSTNPLNGWIEVYKDYNFTTPAMARFAGKTLTDTSGTVRCYVRQGINAHPSFASAIRVAYAWTNWQITRPA